MADIYRNIYVQFKTVFPFINRGVPKDKGDLWKDRSRSEQRGNSPRGSVGEVYRH